MKRHFLFGTKGLAGGMFAEFNSRIDVLLIGFFLTDYATGIYSFAAMLVDGLYHIIAMIRLNFNPILVTAVKDAQWSGAQALMRQTRRLIVPFVASLALCIVCTYYALATWFLPGKGLIEGLPSLIILLTGVVVTSSFIPFDNLMVVSGHPGFQAIQQIGAVTANAGFAIVLLPLIGVEGAATGTALSYISNVLILYILTRRLLGWNLISNSVRPNSNR
jgi:O-antigen/teichoic acid export membrane protein